MSPTPPKGWVRAAPLEGFSSINEISIFEFMGMPFPFRKTFFVQFCFNQHIPLQIHPQAFFTFHTRNESLSPSDSNCCFSIKHQLRWHVNIEPYSSIEDFAEKTNRWHRNNYKKSEKLFTEYGCFVEYIDGDWTEYVPQIYQLYANVAARHGEWLYDLNFFKAITKRSDYKLLLARFDREIIGMTVIQEEPPTLHSICCGFDYLHPSKSYTYSWLNYAFIDQGIKLKKFKNMDAGMTADQSKQNIGYEAVPVCLDVYCKNTVIRWILCGISYVLEASITPSGKLKFSWK